MENSCNEGPGDGGLAKYAGRITAIDRMRDIARAYTSTYERAGRQKPPLQRIAMAADTAGSGAPVIYKLNVCTF